MGLGLTGKLGRTWVGAWVVHGYHYPCTLGGMVVRPSMHLSSLHRFDCLYGLPFCRNVFVCCDMIILNGSLQHGI